MLYTLGHRENYLSYVKEFGVEARKLGKTDDYPGGCVFLTYQDALDTRDNLVSEYRDTFDVFGLETDITNVYDYNGSLALKESCQILVVDFQCQS